MKTLVELTPHPMDTDPSGTCSNYSLSEEADL